MSTAENIRRVLNSSVLRRLYVDEGRSVRATAKVLGVAPTCLWRALKKTGIITRGPGRPRKRHTLTPPRIGGDQVERSEDDARSPRQGG